MSSEEEEATIEEARSDQSVAAGTILDFDYLLSNMYDDDGESFGDDDDVLINLCVICGRDMGSANPRQMCGKTYCMLEDSEETTLMLRSADITMPNNNCDILAEASATLGMLATTTTEKVEEEEIIIPTSAEIEFAAATISIIFSACSTATEI